MITTPRKHPSRSRRNHPSPSSESAGGRPVGEIGQGAILDLAVLAEGFAQEEGGWGVAVGDGGDVHDFCISHTIEHVKINIQTTLLHLGSRIPLTRADT